MTFWAIMPYTEKITYDISGNKYSPISYRWLCFALIIVTEGNQIQLEIPSSVKKVFVNKSGNISY